jgi:DNA-binding transcriptional ArsR family regulator
LLTRTVQLINLLVMESVHPSPPTHPDAARLDAVFTALADPTRRAILVRLAQGEASVAQLSTPFRISQPAISKHLKMLERAGLIARGIDRQRRPARLLAQPMAEAAGWMAHFSRFWGDSFDAMDDLLHHLQTPDDRKEN